MTFPGLMNLAIFLLMGTALLMVWRRHSGQRFARDLGYSTLAAVMVPLGFTLRNTLPVPLGSVGFGMVVLGAMLNLLFLASGVLQLAGRRLPRLVGAAMALSLALALILPSYHDRFLYWPFLNIAFGCTLGVLATRWLWRADPLERLIGPLIVAHALNQLPLILFDAAGVEFNLFMSTVLRVAMALVFLFAALDRATREVTRLYARFELLTEHSLQGIVVTDGQRILYANPAVRGIYGLPLGASAHQLFSELPPAAYDATLLERFHGKLQDHTLEVAHWEGRRVIAGERQLDLRFTAWRIDWDGVPATQILITDDTERNASARELQHQASHDKLTGLPNRSVLMRRLHDFCHPDGAPQCTLVVLNIDRFKLFNQSQGQVTGDHVLQAFAAKLSGALGPRAELMRLGGDEFAIVDPEPGSARDLSWRLHDACQQALAVPGGEYFIDASMGMAVYPANGGDGEALLRAANAAMYQAKRRPGTALVMAELGFERLSSQALEQEQALRKGILNQEIYLDYQPKVCALDGRLRGFEALARWRRPGIGLVSPVEFIQIAERTGQINELGGMLLLQACRQIAEWRELNSGQCVPVAVNVSPVQLLNASFLQLVEEALQLHDVPARFLTLEITESAAVANLEDTQLQLQQLRDMGIDVAMDDFGTGFSSLSMLRQLPLRTLKIDRGLIDPLPAPDAVAVVTAICQLGNALNLQLVAEGVETQEQADCARLAGCQEMQGYFYAKPLTVADAGLWLQRALAAEAAAEAAGELAS